MLALRRPFRRNRYLFITLAITAVLMAGYIALLNHEERVMEEYYENLRQNDPELYLSKIMQSQGFRRYLDEYLQIHDYTKPQLNVPPFLLGRWALFDEAKHVSDSYVPDACLNGVEIEDGRVKFFGNRSDNFAARYSMKGNTVTAHLEGGPATAFDVVGYGSHVHHIKIKTSDAAPQYGYMCR